MAVGCKGNALTASEFGALARDSNCATVEAEVKKQTDPDFFLGIMYDDGICRKKDQNKALEHYLESAKQGNDEAMYSVFYEIAVKGKKERLKPSETKLARYWVIRAAKKDNWRAAMLLRDCYQHGCWFFPIDLEKSKYYGVIFEKYRPNKATQKK